MKALIINGPNLNLLGKRNKEVYGNLSLAEINEQIIQKFPHVQFDFYFSNYEGDLITKLQNLEGYNFLVINPGGLAHYSVSLRDAFESVTISKGVCHLSDVSKREDFRKVDLLKDLADIYVVGLKEHSYFKCIEKLLLK